MRTVVSLLWASLLVASGARGQAKGSLADDAAIRKLVSDYEVAWGRGDVKGAASIYASDVTTVGPEGNLSSGHSDVEKAFEESFAAAYSGSTVAIDIAAIVFARPDVAVVRGSYQVKKGPTMFDKGIFMSVAVKRGGKWLVLAQQSMLPAPSRMRVTPKVK